MIRLHHCPQARSFRTLWLLHEIGIPFKLVRHGFFDKSLRTPEYLAISPAGRVPALEIDGRTMFESGAIAEWLCETRAPHLGRAPGADDRADYLEWLHYAETLGSMIANLTQQHIVLREDWMRSPTVMKLEAKRLALALRAVAPVEWLLPSGFSAADVAVGYAVEIARRFVPLGDIPGLAAYHERLTARPAFRAAMEQDGPPEIYTRDFYAPPGG